MPGTLASRGDRDRAGAAHAPAEEAFALGDPGLVDGGAPARSTRASTLPAGPGDRRGASGASRGSRSVTRTSRPCSIASAGAPPRSPPPATGSPSRSGSASRAPTAASCSGTSRRRLSISGDGTMRWRPRTRGWLSTRSVRPRSGCTSTTPASTRTAVASRMPSRTSPLPATSPPEPIDTGATAHRDRRARRVAGSPARGSSDRRCCACRPRRRRAARPRDRLAGVACPARGGGCRSGGAIAPTMTRPGRDRPPRIADRRASRPGGESPSSRIRRPEVGAVAALCRGRARPIGGLVGSCDMGRRCVGVDASRAPGADRLRAVPISRGDHSRPRRPGHGRDEPTVGPRVGRRPRRGAAPR